jgi:hypothetical protein
MDMDKATDEETGGCKGGRVAEALPSGFAEFWEAYPRRTAKKAAVKAWKAAKDRPPLSDLLAAIEKHKAGMDWQKDGGAFIPHPATWLNQGRWADEVREEQKFVSKYT